MSNKKKNDWEMQIVFAVFLIMCIATLIDIIPAVDGSTWATRLYGIVCLAGVIFCARHEGQFMFIDAFVLLYPKNVQKALSLICKLLSLMFLVFIEISVICSFRNYLGSSPSTVEEIYNGILYVASLLTYPVAFAYIFGSLFAGKGGRKK
ncbi:MAG: hypothetical protein LUE63_02280 [Lachnospiraceae bacterium]|nr:hypothetical protein [Lachnospiraceae bacterium]